MLETWRGGVVGPAHGDSGVDTVREPDDEIRIGTSADADDLNLLGIPSPSFREIRAREL